MKKKREFCVECGKIPPYSNQAIYCLKCLAEKSIIKEKVKACNVRAKKMGAEGTFTVDEWKALCDKYGMRCLCCCINGEYHTLTPDHVVSMSQGGTNHIDNIQTICPSCNSSKGNKTIDYRNDPVNQNSRLFNRWIGEDLHSAFARQRCYGPE